MLYARAPPLLDIPLNLLLFLCCFFFFLVSSIFSFNFCSAIFSLFFLRGEQLPYFHDVG